MNNLPYDDSSIEGIFKYSKELIELSFVDVLKKVFSDVLLNKKIEYYKNPRGKGSLGNLLQEHYYFYKPNSDSNPDFYKVGMELKVTPYEKTAKGLRAGERLVITMIPNNKPIDKEFKGSHLENKIKLILMIWYLRIKNEPRTNHKICYVNLYDIYSEICSKDLEIILEDYKTIVEKVTSGNSHKLSEGDTKYLGACTKGATASKSLQPQFYNSNIPAKRRAFSLKKSYMTYILNNYVNAGLMNYDSIFDKGELLGNSFDEKVIEKINKFVGKTEKELYKEFNINSTVKSKHINRTLVYRILGVNTEKAEEFEKANIVIKTVRVQKNGKPRESMSFPKIIIKNIVNQDFYDSFEYDFFETTRFLFVVFQDSGNGEYILKGARFWNMPIDELETIGKSEWESYKNKFLTGVNFEIKKNKYGKEIVYNDLPNKSETTIFHLRPHSSKSAHFKKGSSMEMVVIRIWIFCLMEIRWLISAFGLIRNI